MLISDKIIYFELQKTGCTHTRNILLAAGKGQFKAFGKHNSFKSLDEDQKSGFDSLIKVGNIRNPYDWYVSLWAYGCMNSGGFRSRVKKNSNRPDLWNKVYSDSEDKVLFKKWLFYVLEERVQDIAEYKQTKIPNYIGLYTTRYLRLYTKRFIENMSIFKNYKSIQNLDASDNFIDIILKNEKLEANLIKYASKLNLDKTELKNTLSIKAKKTNTSKRRRYQYYYDNDSKDLVRMKDKLILTKFNYSFKSK